jgi:hypothetical protein
LHSFMMGLFKVSCCHKPKFILFEPNYLLNFKWFLLFTMMNFINWKMKIHFTIVKSLICLIFFSFCIFDVNSIFYFKPTQYLVSTV